MKLQIFDVEHGACALLTCDNGARLMIDCGHNSSTGWFPGEYLASIGVTHLDELVITNYDEDHVSGIRNLFARVFVGWITRNTTVSPADIGRLKAKEGAGPGIAFLMSILQTNFLPPGCAQSPPPSFPDVQLQPFFLSYPHESEDENDLSCALKLNCRGVNILFPGDLERSGWSRMITKPGFIEVLKHLDILVASHHGREDGCYDELFSYCKPRFIVISDKAKGFQSQETANYYYDRSIGGVFRGQDGRHVLTTRADGNITIEFGDAAYAAY